MNKNSQNAATEIYNLVKGVRSRDLNAIKTFANYSFEGTYPFALNYTTAAKYYNALSVDKLSSKENENLAKMYYTGEGISKDTSKAISIFKRIPLNERKDDVLKAIAIYAYDKKNYIDVIENLEKVKVKDQEWIKYYLEKAYYSLGNYGKHIKLVETFNDEYANEHQAFRYIKSVFTVAKKSNIKNISSLNIHPVLSEKSILSALKISDILIHKKNLPLELKDPILSLLVDFYSGKIITDCYSDKTLLELSKIQGCTANKRIKMGALRFVSTLLIVVLYSIFSSKLFASHEALHTTSFYIISFICLFLGYVAIKNKNILKNVPRLLIILISLTFLGGMLNNSEYSYFFYLPNLILTTKFAIYLKKNSLHFKTLYSQ